MTPAVTAATLKAAIAARFAPTEWCTAFEVGDAAGFGRSRSADAVAMNTWPSRGLELWGFEVKVTRSDWVRELKDPGKSAPIQRYCDRWAVVVANDKVVQDGELPVTWGLFVYDDKKLVQRVEPPKLAAEPVTKSFMACLLRASLGASVPLSVVNERIDQRVDAEVARRKANSRAHADVVERERDELRAALATFEKASGIHIAAWNEPQKIGEAVRMILNDGPGQEKRLRRVRDMLSNMTSELDGALSEMTGRRRTS